MDLSRSTAVVTGGSRGIGREVAQRLAGAGARVLVVARGEATLCHAAERIGAQPLPADVSQAADVERVAAAARELLGAAPDMVVNAAGAFVLAPLERTSVEDFDRVIAANLRAAFLVIRAFLPPMLERGSGHLVTVGSIAGRLTFPHNGAYSASKFGVRGLHGVLDAETRGTGVRATLVEPAATDTSLWDAVDFEATPGLPPRDAMLRPEAVADAVVWALTRPADVDVREVRVERA